MRRPLLLAFVFSFLGGTANAFNRTPGSATATSFQPYQFYFGDEGSKMREVAGDNHYVSTWYLGTSPPTLTPQVTIDDFNTQLQACNGIFHISTADDGRAAIEVREPTENGANMTSAAYIWYREHGWTYYEIFWSSLTGAGYHIGLQPTGIANRFRSDETFVHAEICRGSNITWPDARVVLTRSDCPGSGTVQLETTTLWRRLSGADGRSYRTVANAIAGLGLIAVGSTATVLAPVPVNVLPLPGTIISGTTAGHAYFDCDMDETSPNSAVDGGSNFLLANGWWQNPNHLTFDIVPTHSGSGMVSISSLGAKSAGGIALDGDGVTPNDDSYWWLLTSTFGPPNTAAAFDVATAWTETDGLHVAWITGAEHGSNRFEVFAGPNKGRLLVTVPAAGSPTTPHYYEVVTPPDGSDVFQVYEEDDDPTVDYATPYLSREPRPTNIDGLRLTNATVASWPDPADPNRYAGLPEHGEAPLRDLSPHYVFISTRNDFISAVQPVIDWYESHGKVVATVVTGSPSPDLIRDFLDDFYGQAVQQGRPVPFVYLVGEANEGSVPAYNIVGMEYFTDADCFWDSCSSDLDLVDVNGDGKPEMNWSRIIAHDMPTLQKSVASGLEALNGQNFSSPRALCVLGDGNATCQPQLEPTATFDAIIMQYQAHSVPVIRILDSGLPCSDWLARRTAAVNALQGGITEFIGSGRTTNRLNLGFVIQKQWQYPWDMALVTRRQGIVVQLPGCGLGDADRNFADQSQYPGLAYTFLNHDPALGTTAVAWHSLSRGAPEPEHLLMARTYFQQRWSGTVHTSHEAHFRTIRECWELYPELRPYLRRAVNFGWETRLDGMIIAVDDPAPAPAPPQILRVSPNPFTSFTAIRYTVPRTGKVTLAIYDVAGRCVRTLLDDVESVGTHTVHWDGRNGSGQQVAAGTYFVRETLGDAVFTAKLTLAP